MKIDFIVISCALVVLCFLPFVLFPLFGNQLKNKLSKKFKEEALRLNINISYKQNWNTNIAGIDLLKKQFLFVQVPENEILVRHIDLSKIGQVKVSSHYAEYNLYNKPVQTLSRLDLEFYHNNSNEISIVSLFDYTLNFTEDYEVKNAEKLVLELQKYLNSMPILKHTA